MSCSQLIHRPSVVRRHCHQARPFPVFAFLDVRLGDYAGHSILPECHAVSPVEPVEPCGVKDVPISCIPNPDVHVWVIEFVGFGEHRDAWEGHCIAEPTGQVSASDLFDPGLLVVGEQFLRNCSDLRGSE